MSLCLQGLNTKTRGGKVTIEVKDTDPLIRLANLIDWNHLAELAKPDLIKTRKKLWWLGRKLRLRPHLGAMILQMLFKWTDRGTEANIKGTPACQIFCGLDIVLKWCCPDHTKIEKFRNRLSPETHKKIGDYILQLAVQCGFGDPSKLDVDSTVQEANISYPADAVLMKKLALKCAKVLSFLKETGSNLVPLEITIGIKMIIKKSQQYFFLAKNTCKKKKNALFAEYHSLVKKELLPFMESLESLSLQRLKNLPWNYRRVAIEIMQKGKKYLEDVR